VAFLMEQLRVEDPIIRKARAPHHPGNARTCPCRRLKMRSSTKPDRNLSFNFSARWADCHNAQSFQLLEAKAIGEDPENPENRA
jgi:hypothetical protein